MMESVFGGASARAWRTLLRKQTSDRVDPFTIPARIVAAGGIRVIVNELKYFAGELITTGNFITVGNVTSGRRVVRIGSSLQAIGKDAADNGDTDLSTVRSW